MAAKKISPQTKTAPAAETAPVAAPPAEVPAVEPTTNVDPVQEKLDSVSDKLVLLANTVKELQAVVKVLQKDYVKTVKTASKRTRKAAGGAKRVPSGFAKPAKLSDELCDFLALARGSELARTEVTRKLNAYIKENQLQDQADKRNIKPDASLKKIMNIGDDVKLTYFNLQTYIKHHFVNLVAPAPSA